MSYAFAHLNFVLPTTVMDEIRIVLTDSTWERLAEVLAEVKSPAGAPPELPDRSFVEAVLFVARTGIPWRDLPKCFGKWDAVYQRFRRWQRAGYWQALFQDAPQALAKIELLLFDSTVVRAHPHAAGARKKNGGQAAQALGRSRGGFGTKIHLAAADERTAVAVELTPGQQGDATVFEDLLQAVPQGVPVTFAAADTAYDSDANRGKLLDRDIAPVIPSHPNRTDPIPHDQEVYKQRNRVERLINKRKQFRRVATRYEKLAVTFLAFVQLTLAVIAIR
jgi:transposase